MDMFQEIWRKEGMAIIQDGRKYQAFLYRG